METITDLAALDTSRGAEEGFELRLVHPKTGEALPATIRVLGADSDAYRDKQRQFQRKASERLVTGRRMRFTPEELEAQALEMLGAVTVGWDFGAMKLDGQPVPPCSGAAAVKLYQRFGWIREQIDAAVQDRANFLPASATGS